MKRQPNILQYKIAIFGLYPYTNPYTKKRNPQFCDPKAPRSFEISTETFARWSALVRLGSNQAWNLAKGIRTRLVGNICLFDAVEPRSFEILA